MLDYRADTDEMPFITNVPQRTVQREKLQARSTCPMSHGTMQLMALHPDA